MKRRTIFGGLVILSAAVLPLTSVAAANEVDYEKSVGQVDGADTINWVVEATDDGGYVVGGQTLGCYKVDWDELEPMSVNSTNNGEMVLSAIPSYYDKVAYAECVEYFQEHGNNSTNPSSYLLDICLSDNTFPTPGDVGDFGLSSFNDGEDYTFSCIDYIAKFKKDGTKEWLTTVNNNTRPVAVKKINDGSYRMHTSDSYLYTFTSKGVEDSSKRTEYAPEAENRGYFNDNGSFVFTSDSIFYLDKNGANEETIQALDGHKYSSLYPSGDNYVVNDCINEDSAIKCVVADASKDLSSLKERKLEGVPEDENIILYSANADGDVLIGYGNEENYTFASYNKNGKLIAKINNPEQLLSKNDTIIGLKDFTIGIVGNDNTVNMTAQKIIKFNRDLTTKYEYAGSGHELIADVSELNDESLVGVGLAQKDSSKMPVTGDVNGGYLRLVAKTNKPVDTTKPNVKNPKTWDAVDTIATVGGIALLGLGVFLHRNLGRR